MHFVREVENWVGTVKEELPVAEYPSSIMSEQTRKKSNKAWSVALLSAINAMLPDWLSGKVIEYLRLRKPLTEEAEKEEETHAVHRDMRESVAQRLIYVSYAFVFATFAPFFLSRFTSTIGFVAFLFLPGMFTDLGSARIKKSYLTSPFFIAELLSMLILFSWMNLYEKYPLQVALDALRGEAYSFPIFLAALPILAALKTRGRRGQ